MKKIIFLVAVAIFALSCKEKVQEATTTTQEVAQTIVKEYPEGIAPVFKAHGGIQTWNDMNNLTFTLKKDNGDELHTVDLKSRKVTIKTDKYTLGFNGEKVWVAQDSAHYPIGRARFYHNLMFYFYAMPFVLGDDGITYSDTPALEFEGVTYPGTKISFGSGVGDAPDDEYIVYRNPETNQMEWLAYTVTYGKNEKSDRFSYIKYDQWNTIGGLQLPKVLQWYKVEDGVPTEMSGERVFANATISNKVLDASQFDIPVGAEVEE
ncbi:hypothetical protein GCM10011344_06120 [Dokdonia pacifica]|uniref:Threonine synthase n=1 Tax=Dokdonia pacifica TaxID=1627892 RepID=A0A238ZS94_9FLAO|nr:DUF6503 family protein [Dokdonia pacifica]GGG08320.1 hypothetical protein GCM10011344_06120 [Dokdonia pacifica]SNR86287.1 hypothetical protein SAMN06265376_103480 [Dokdonia pacifica]